VIYALATALVLALLAAGFLGWRLWDATKLLRRLERERHAWQQDKVIRQNLQQMIDGRNAEVKRLRSRLKKSEAALADMEKQASELHLNLFHESGLRILREKEEGARRMKLALMEKQLDEANRKLKAQKDEASRRLKEQKAEALADEARLSGIIAQQQAEIEKLTASQARRAPRRAHTDLPNQMTLSDLLDDAGDEPAKERAN
jgi:chromosome segregation ATPase